MDFKFYFRYVIVGAKGCILVLYGATPFYEGLQNW